MNPKNYPHLSVIELKNLLRRRKTNLKDWVNQNGIFTYDLLVERCNRLGVVPPTVEEFNLALPEQEVSSPTEGVVVLPPPPVVLESTGEIVEDTVPELPELEVTVPERKKRR